jgi:hypothetical protein
MTESLATALDAMAFDAGALEELYDEILRYLGAVELFRREGHEPSWRVEGTHPEVLR